MGHVTPGARRTLVAVIAIRGMPASGARPPVQHVACCSPELRRRIGGVCRTSISEAAQPPVLPNSLDESKRRADAHSGNKNFERECVECQRRIGQMTS